MGGRGHYAKLVSDERFLLSILRTLYFTALSVLIPMVLGLLAALAFARKFRCAGWRAPSSSCR